MGTPEKTTVEVTIAREVYEAALTRANSMGQELTAVARAFIGSAALVVLDTDPPTGRPPMRPYGQDRKPMRFPMPLDTYRSGSRAIKAGGRSVSSALEDALAQFAATGQIPQFTAAQPERAN